VLPNGAIQSPRAPTADERKAGSPEDILAAVDGDKGPDAEQTEEQKEEEEIPGHIDLTRLNWVVACNTPKLCRIFFPKGERIGDEWVVADSNGSPAESFKIELIGPKAGHWVSLPALPEEKQKTGKFIELLILSRTWSFQRAVTNIAGALGVQLIQPWEDYVLSQDVFYESAATHYWIPRPKGGWTKVVEAGAKRLLQDKGISKSKPKNAIMSPMDRALLALNRHMDVAYAGPLCGFAAREMTVHGQRILVTNSRI
jgi:hypothetical protein